MLKRVLQSDVPIESAALAQALLGMKLVHMTPEGRTSGLIVETEAYPVGDPSSHAYRGLTPRCRSMFLRHWHAYVYRIYGRLFCLNISSEPAGAGAAVLIRALEPLDGIEIMQQRRGTTVLRDLTRGPGRLTKAMGIGIELDGVDLDTSPRLFLESASSATTVVSSPRIGLSKSIDWPLRFYYSGNPFVSGPCKLNQGSRIIQ